MSRPQGMRGLRRKMEHTVFTVPNNKPWVLTKEEAEEFLKDAPDRKMTKEERAEIRERVEKLFKKPEKQKDG